MFQHCASEEVRLEEEMPLITHLGSQISEYLKFWCTRKKSILLYSTLKV